MKSLVIGVVGHIDHGKTTLIKALTGIDTDTLPEEKLRGMTIDIGISNIKFPSGNTAEIIDVPGHKKFIKNLTVGISGIDFFILVIACDDGIMPQTIEHLQLLRLFNKKNGVIVLTKRDLVTSQQYERVLSNCKEYFKNTALKNKIFTFNNNISDLINFIDIEIQKYLSYKEKSKSDYINSLNFRLNVDKIFSIKGSGTIVTGTINQGSIDFEKNITLYPQNLEIKIKNIQNHGKNVKNLDAGKRCALNISGININEINRGNSLAISDSMYVGKIVDTKLYLLPNIKKLKNNHRVKLNIGTNEVIATISLLDKNFLLGGENCFAQLIFEKDIAYLIKDIGIIRDFSLSQILGNIKIINNSTLKVKKNDIFYLNMLKDFESDNIEKLIENKIKYSGLISKKSIAKFVNLQENSDYLKIILNKLQTQEIIISFDLRYIHRENLFKLYKLITDFLEKFHRTNRLTLGVSKAEIVKTFLEDYSSKEIDIFFSLSFIRENIILKNNLIYLKDFKIKLNKSEKNMKEIIFSTYKKQQFNIIPKDKLFKNQDNNILFNQMHQYMLENNFIISLDKKHFMLHGFFKESIKLITNYIEKNKILGIKDTREILNCNRVSAILILEKLDSLRITKLHNGNRILFIKK